MSVSIRSPESESESEQPNHDSALLVCTLHFGAVQFSILVHFNLRSEAESEATQTFDKSLVGIFGGMNGMTKGPKWWGRV